MKKHIKRTIKGHVIRGAFYLILLLAICVIPFALAQRTTGKQSTVGSTMHLRDRDASNLPTREFPTGGGLWNQYDNPATEPPLGIGSQKFEPAMAAFDDQAADDFVVDVPPPPIFLYITGVRVMGEYSEAGGPASSFNVYFYRNDAGHVPGALIASFLNRPYSGTPPDFTIQWTPMSIFPSSGTYWVSVQAVQNFNPNGQWFWHNRTVQTNAGAVWQNPGDGYGTGCITWNRKNACMVDQVWPDQVFQILGFAEGPTPTSTPTPPSSPSPTPTATPTPTPIGCSGFFQDFDGVTPPALPSGWTAANAINPDGLLWQTSNSGLPSPPADSPPNAAWVNDPATASDKRLNSPPVRIEPLENAALSFRHNFAFEDGFDGGVLEISLDDGPFQDAAPFIFQGGYNGTISTCCGNPLAGRQAWTGSSGGFMTTSVTLPQNHTIALRWRMGSDNGGSGQGWRIDTAQTFCERPTPTSTPTATPPSPTPTTTATFTPTPAATATPTATSSATSTPTATATATPTNKPSPTPTATPTPTARPTPTSRPNVTPRTRPTPPPRP
jgi:hypothetical protein